MKLELNKTADTTIPRIYLVRQDDDLKKILEGDDLSQAEKRFAAGKKDAKMYLPHTPIFIQKIEEKKGPRALRLEEARLAAFRLYGEITDLDVESIQLINGGVDADEVLAWAEGMALSSYQFLKYYSEADKKKNKLDKIEVLDSKLDRDQVVRMENLIRAVYLGRNLVNEPLSFLTAEQLAREFEKMGEEAGFSVEVFNKKKIESLKMGGLLAVNKGSIDPPTFSIMTWKPDSAINKRPLVLVGKGVVYDTGGLSLKPTHDSMDYMKCDMGGAAAVAGAMFAAAKNRLPLWIIALVPATDNRPDGNAYVPGDVVRMYDGSTVEVLNTDAEGRMILADALAYAKQYDPEAVLELSTLTGSAHAAIDKYGIVGMGNAGREVMENLKESGEYSCERIAEFPFWDEYREQLKSDIADLKNIGGRYGGAITAGKFLEHFTDYPYIHLDIAGPAFNKVPFNYRGKGGSAVGIRLLYHYFLNRSM